MRNRVEETLRALLLRHKPELVFTSGVNLVFHQNSSTMISLTRKGRSGTLRMHNLFCDAPPSVLEAIVCTFFTRVGRRKSKELRSRILDFLEENREAALSSVSLPRIRPPRGRVYNLVDVRRRVVNRYLPECRPMPVRVGWSYRATPALMGKWVETPADSPNLIVVNRLLDDKRVPLYYLEYILFHETLHDLYPIRRENGRWVHHPVEFRRRERLFPYYREAQRWERENLTDLINTTQTAERVRT